MGVETFVLLSESFGAPMGVETFVLLSESFGAPMGMETFVLISESFGAPMGVETFVLLSESFGAPMGVETFVLLSESFGAPMGVETFVLLSESFYWGYMNEILSEREMSRPKRKSPIDVQKELVRLAYEKKASKSPSTQVSSFGHPMPFGQPTSFGSTSQSPSLGGASDLSVPFPREPRVGNDTPSGYLQRYSQRVMGMAGVEEDSLMTRSVDEVVASFNKMHLQHHKQRISFLDDSIKNLEHQLQERDAKLMDRDNSIRVLELDRGLVEKTVNELKSEKAQVEAQKAFLGRKMEK
ncbi:hypothetical protein LWI29_027459 [Acer saccharum]|uniref:Uncharacterized protein n=1 Tax=Acer saccharum TaxID=4024 RepID=A0AA39SF59_ACESA|nr:hypothetical protein LWI29_027459 [Acer saccharum]